MDVIESVLKVVSENPEVMYPALLVLGFAILAYFSPAIFKALSGEKEERVLRKAPVERKTEADAIQFIREIDSQLEELKKAEQAEVPAPVAAKSVWEYGVRVKSPVPEKKPLVVESKPISRPKTVPELHVPATQLRAPAKPPAAVTKTPLTWGIQPVKKAFEPKFIGVISAVATPDFIEKLSPNDFKVLFRQFGFVLVPQNLYDKAVDVLKRKNALKVDVGAKVPVSVFKHIEHNHEDNIPLTPVAVAKRVHGVILTEDGDLMKYARKYGLSTWNYGIWASRSKTAGFA
ncbi:MAG: hypothetical protein NTU61_06225 [Candidatus Altiarchaeota archaeon]|nr:hypothetical protein [Candidatus Altiarchaeota archaeon]